MLDVNESTNQYRAHDRNFLHAMYFITQLLLSSVVFNLDRILKREKKFWKANKFCLFINHFLTRTQFFIAYNINEIL